MAEYDVVAFGETMMRLTPPGFLRIEQTRSFDIWVGGTESNTAVGLARLGMKAAWFSRLPDSPIGRYISSRIRQHGVDVSHVIWAADERLGIYFHEKAQSPRASRIIYDRQGSAMSRMQPQDLPAALFQSGRAKLLHVTGITLAISATARAAVQEAAQRAKAAGWLVSFDTNYRSMLWSPEAAAAGCQPTMALADVIFCPLADYEVMYGAAKPQAAAEALAGLFPNALIVMTLGGDGALARTPRGELLRQPAIPTRGSVGRIGGGDAFAAGFLYAWLKQGDAAEALKWAAAMSACKFTVPGDLPLVDYDEVAALAAGAAGGGLIR